MDAQFPISLVVGVVSVVLALAPIHRGDECGVVVMG